MLKEIFPSKMERVIFWMAVVATIQFLICDVIPANLHFIFNLLG